jgi:hypothetical protein
MMALAPISELADLGRATMELPFSAFELLPALSHELAWLPDVTGAVPSRE